MDRNDLLEKLHGIIDTYVSDESKASELKKEIRREKVKYVLGEIEQYRKKPFSSKDQEIIKDLFFYFC